MVSLPRSFGAPRDARASHQSVAKSDDTLSLWHSIGEIRQLATHWLSRLPEHLGLSASLQSQLAHAAELLRHDKADEAIVAYLTLTQDFPDNALAWAGLGHSYRRKGDQREERSTFKKALSLAPFLPQHHLDYAKTLYQCGDIDKSIHHYKRVIQLDSTSVDARFDLALAVELLGQFDEAVVYYRDILEHDPEFLPAYNNLGSILLRQEYYSEAEAVFRQLVNYAPNFSRGYLGLAITLDRQGKLQESLEAYHQVLRLNPTKRNSDYIQNRIITLNAALGRSKTRNNLTLIRVK